jgi:hypothetical protein
MESSSELLKAIELSKQSFKQEEKKRTLIEKVRKQEEKHESVKISDEGIHYLSDVNIGYEVPIKIKKHSFYWYTPAQSVDIAGTFNGWKPEPMKYSQRNQLWRKRIPLWPIIYQYKYVIDESDWKTDNSCSTVRDLQGNINNELILGSVEQSDQFHELFDIYLTGIGNELGLFNFNKQFTSLLVRHTLGDGNCLCNAASLAIWNTQDTDLILRICIRNNFKTLKDIIYPYFENEFKKNSKQLFGSNFEISKKDIQEEWESEEKCLLTQSRYLTSFHTFLLSNILCRPILLYADDPSILQGLGGIYLPWLWYGKLPQGEEHKNPLAILYYENHYSLIVPTESEGVYPIVNPKGKLLPLRYTPQDKQKESPKNILSEWLILKQIKDGHKLMGAAFSGLRSLDI